MADTVSGEQTVENGFPVSQRWLAIFEDRHGHGSHKELLSLLEQPCVTFAKIAARFGVTRKCVRQWHLLLMPDAPRGHARQRQCSVLRQRRRLLDDELFRAFFRHARGEFARERIELLKSADGYRRRAARIDRRLVAITEAKPVVDAHSGVSRYVIGVYRGPAEFLYLRLSDTEFLVLPTHELSRRRLVFVDAPSSSHWPFKNTFAAMNRDAMAAPA